METLTFPKLGSPPRFNFGQSFYDSENPSTASTPFVSAPSSPGKNGAPGFYFSAPTSPNWATRIALHETSAHSTGNESTDGHPFSWEEKPGTPKKRGSEGVEEVNSFSLEGFEFEFSARFSVPEEPPMSPTPMYSANELFFNGQIRPLRPPPRLQHLPPVRVCTDIESSKVGSFNLRSNVSSTLSSPRSPRSPLKQGQQLIKGALCGLSNPADNVLDPFTVAMEEMTKRDVDRKHRRARSLSPLRIFHWDDQPAKPGVEPEEFLRSSTQSSNDEKESCKDLKFFSPKVSKRWSLKDLLRRSKSEGTSKSQESSRRSTDGRSDSSNFSRESFYREKESARKSVDEGNKTRNLVATNGTALRNKAPQRLPRGVVSPLELYTMQKAQSEGIRKKTHLPYKEGVLGCLGITTKGYRTLANISKGLQPVS